MNDLNHDKHGQRLFGLRDIAELTGFTVSALRVWVRKGLVAPGLRLGVRTALRWPASDLPRFRAVAALKKPRK